jgi:hypothetical protein
MWLFSVFILISRWQTPVNCGSKWETLVVLRTVVGFYLFHLCRDLPNWWKSDAASFSILYTNSLPFPKKEEVVLHPERVCAPGRTLHVICEREEHGSRPKFGILPVWQNHLCLHQWNTDGELSRILCIQSTLKETCQQNFYATKSTEYKSGKTTVQDILSDWNCLFHVDIGAVLHKT